MLEPTVSTSWMGVPSTVTGSRPGFATLKLCPLLGSATVFAKMASWPLMV